MAPRPDPVESDERIPARASVAVIGGGIAGVSTAIELAERGIDVVLCEKGEIGAEQSSRNWGWCRQMGRDPREIPLVIESLKLWRGMNERVEAETGFRECGILYLAADDRQVESKARWVDEHARPHQLDSKLISGEEVAKLLPGASVQWKGALYTKSDGRAEPIKAAPAIAKAARRRGAKVFTRCAVRGVETSAGRISAIVTEKGSIACDSVVLAGGAWSRRFCGNLGIELPQLGVVNSVLRTVPVETPLESSAAGAKFAFRKRCDGGYTVAHSHFSVADIVPDSFRLFGAFLPALRLDWRGLKLRLGHRFLDEARLKRRWKLDETSPFETVRILDPEPVGWILDEAFDSLKATYPVFQGVGIAERWAGLIDVTPDAVPVISPVESLPGFYLATGFSGHGFGIGPGAGRLMADLVTGRRPVVDPEPFRYSRMIDGTRLQPLAGP